MKILLAVTTFAVTIGAVFLFNKNSNPHVKDQLAQIANIESSGPIPASKKLPSVKQSLVSNSTNIPTPSNTSNSTPVSTTTLPIQTSSPTSSPTPVPIPTQSPTLSPSTSSPQVSPKVTQTPVTVHIFYTSSHWKAKYYYCDTDDGWKDLSANYLKSFNSVGELLAQYPTRISHAPCQ